MRKFKIENRKLASAAMLAVLLLFCSCELAFGQAFGRGNFGRTGSGEDGFMGKAELFYDMTAPYPAAVWRPGIDNVYGICAAGTKIGVCRSEPANGLNAGVLSGVYYNHKATLDTNKFELKTAFGHQWTDQEILVRRFKNGAADTLTERLLVDSTIVRGWQNMGAFQHQHMLSDFEYSSPMGAMVSSNRSSNVNEFYRSYIAFPMIEFADSIEVWVRSAAGGEFNDFGGVNGMQESPVQNVYHGVEYFLVPTAMDLYGRRVGLQARRTIPRNQDISILGWTPKGRRGFVWALSYGVSPGFTLATNAPWSVSSPYGPNFRKFADNVIGHSMLEEDQVLFCGDSLMGQPYFTQLHGEHASGSSTVRIAKPTTKQWADFVPDRASPVFYGQYIFFAVRDAAVPTEGGFVGCVTSLADCTSYWKGTLATLTDEVTGATFDQTYQAGDGCVLFSNYVWRSTGSEDAPARGGFYNYNARHSFGWQGYTANKYDDIYPDSMLWNVAGSAPLVGTKSPGHNLYRVFGSGYRSQQFRFGADGRFVWAILKSKPNHGGTTLSNYSWMNHASMWYVTEDSDDYYSPMLPAGVIADTIYLYKGYIVDNSANSWANVQLTADSVGSGFDSLKAIGGVSGQLDFISLNLSTGGAWALHRPILIFDSETGSVSEPWSDSIDASNHKVQDSTWLEVFQQGTSWNGLWLSGAHFADDSSYWSVTDLDWIPNYTTVSSSYLKFMRGADSLAGVKGSAYDYPSDQAAKIKWTLPPYTVREGKDTQLGLLWSTWDDRAIAPQIGTGGATNIRRLNLLGAGYPDQNLWTRLIVFSHSESGAASPDTVYISFQWRDLDSDGNVDAGESYVKDVSIRSDTPTSPRDGDNPNTVGYTNASPDRTYRQLISLEQTARDSIEGWTIVSAGCSILVTGYDSAAVRSFYAFPVGHATANVTWNESQVTWNARSTGNNWQSAGGDYLSTATDTLATFTNTATTFNTAPMATTNEWIWVPCTKAIEEMASTVIADSTRDGFIIVPSGTHPDTQNARVTFNPSDFSATMSPNQTTGGATTNMGSVILHIVAIPN